MNQSSTILALLARIAHLGEVHRLLYVLKRVGHPIGEDELVHLTAETSGWGPRYPRPKPAILIAQRFGFIAFDQQQRLFVTKVGESMIASTSHPAVDLDKVQGKLIAAALRDEPSFDRIIRSLLPQFREVEGGRLVLPKRADHADHEFLVLRLLQQIKLLSDAGDNFTVDPEFETILLSHSATSVSLTEEGLWRRLEKQRLRAREIELLVLEYERLRLVAAGRSDLSESVVRVSEKNVSAGFDIISFEIGGEARLIEVKSSTSGSLQFFWSERERAVAAENPKAYWIYFVPFSEQSTKELAVLLLINDPLKAIEKKKLVELPDSWRVCAPLTFTEYLPKSVITFSSLA